MGSESGEFVASVGTDSVDASLGGSGVSTEFTDSGDGGLPASGCGDDVLAMEIISWAMVVTTSCNGDNFLLS